MAKKLVTEERFKAMREQLNQADSATKEVPLGAIKINDDSITERYIEIQGNRVPVSDNFFRKMATGLKMSRSLTNEMIKNEDGKVASALMRGLKEYRAGRKGSENVMLIANSQSKMIVDICSPNGFRRLSNSSVMDVTERIMNSNPNISIETIDFDPRTGTSSINLLNGEEVGFGAAGKDEFFKFGFSIVQGARDTYVEMYNQRLVCSNGLRVSLGQGAIGGDRSINFEEKFRLTGTDAEDIRIFLNRIEDMRKAGFVPSAFGSALERATSTKASLFEVEHAMLTAQRKVREEDPELKKSYLDSVARKYFHSHAETMARIVQKGQDPYALSDKHKSFIRTGMSVWDVINSLTFLGSNNSGIQFDNQYEMKSTAGKLFAKGQKDGYDLQFVDYIKL